MISALPIYIGLWEAISINTALNNEISPRPLTHDLFLEFLNRYEVTLKALHIDSLDNGISVCKSHANPEQAGGDDRLQA